MLLLLRLTRPILSTGRTPSSSSRCFSCTIIPKATAVGHDITGSSVSDASASTIRHRWQQQQQQHRSLPKINRPRLFSTSTTNGGGGSGDNKNNIDSSSMSATTVGSLNDHNIGISTSSKDDAIVTDRGADIGSSSSSSSVTESEMNVVQGSNDDDGNSNDNSTTDSQRFVYVHPLSQIVLQYLQDCRHEWIIQRGLDSSLTLHRDGSFELKTPTPPTTTTNDDDNNGSSTSMFHSSCHPQTSSRIWTSYDEQEKKHWLSVQVTVVEKMDEEESDNDNNNGLSNSSVEEVEEFDKHRPNNNSHHRHHRGSGGVIRRVKNSIDGGNSSRSNSNNDGSNSSSLNQRFLLQDNLLPAWHGNRKSLPERIHVAVDEMVRSVDRFESSRALVQLQSNSPLPSSARSVTATGGATMAAAASSSSTSTNHVVLPPSSHQRRRR